MTNINNQYFKIKSAYFSNQVNNLLCIDPYINTFLIYKQYAIKYKLIKIKISALSSIRLLRMLKIWDIYIQNEINYGCTLNFINFV